MRISDWSSDVCSSDPPALMDVQHHPGRVFEIHAEKPLEHQHDEFHRRVIVIQHQDFVQVRLLGFRLGFGGDAEFGAVIIRITSLRHSQRLRRNHCKPVGDHCGTLHLAMIWYRSASRQESTRPVRRSEEPTSELQSLMRISYAVFCLKKTIKKQ